MTTHTDTSETMSLSLLDALTALWKKETVEMVAAAVRRALEPVPDVRIISIAYALEDDDTRCLHVILDVETDEGTKRLAFYRRSQGFSFTKGTWIPKRLLAVRVTVERSWVTDAWLEQLGLATEPEIPMAHDSSMGNIPLPIVLAHSWRLEDCTAVEGAIRAALAGQQISIAFSGACDTESLYNAELTVVEGTQWWHKCFCTTGRTREFVHAQSFDGELPTDSHPTFDPFSINVRIPIALFLA